MFVRRLVSGVRSSCDASATSCRCALLATPRAPPSIVLKLVAEAAELVAARPPRCGGVEVARRGDLLGGVGQPRAPARARRARRASPRRDGEPIAAERRSASRIQRRRAERRRRPRRAAARSGARSRRRGRAGNVITRTCAAPTVASGRTARRRPGGDRSDAARRPAARRSSLRAARDCLPGGDELEVAGRAAERRRPGQPPKNRRHARTDAAELAAGAAAGATSTSPRSWSANERRYATRRGERDRRPPPRRPQRASSRRLKLMALAARSRRRAPSGSGAARRRPRSCGAGSRCRRRARSTSARSRSPRRARRSATASAPGAGCAGTARAG